MKVYIEPHFRGADKGEGGIRRIVEAQQRWLPRYGVEVVGQLEQADVVATHAGNKPIVPVNKPWIVHTHGLYWAEYDWEKWSYELNKEVVEAMRQADKVTAPSEWVAYTLARGMWIRAAILYHGIEPDEWPVGENGGYVLWNKTRVDPVCDPEPVDTLAERMPKQAFISTFGTARDNVKITGRQSYQRAAPTIRNAGVYLATTRETFGIGTLEAMCTGVPVVGWRWGGQAEFIQHGVTGWLATPGDFDSLQKGIEWALANRQKVGMAARALVLERFTWERVMEQYAALYSGAVKAFERIATAPKVSVIIPCYNLGRFLPDCLRSLQAQTIPDWEAVVVDDASPDDTAAVAKAFAAQDTRIRYIRNPKNLYLAGALNAGIAASTGRYLINLDADNMISPHTLEILSHALDDDRAIHIAYGAVQFVLEDGKKPDTSIAPDGISPWPPAFNYAQQVQGRNQIPSTAMYRRIVAGRSGGYRRRYRTAEDAENWTRVTSLGFRPQRVTDAVTLIYRQRPDSMSRVEKQANWTAWFPWARQQALTPFGAPIETPARIGHFWPVPSYEPPRVSVIIAVGPGHEELVIDALDSVEAQTFRQWECIVINDTGKPLPSLPPWAKVLDTGGRRGPGYARNLGIRAMKAPLFVPLDADDYLQADALDTMLARWKEWGGVVYSQWYDDLGDGQVKVYDPPEYDAHLLTDKGCIHAVTAMYSKADWETVGGFDEKLSHWEDWDFQLALAAKGICGNKIARPLFTYRKATGVRRESNYKTFDQGRAEILGKWRVYFEKREVLMACAGCGAKRAEPANPPASQQGNGAAPPAGAALLEFTGQQQNILTFKGEQTGTKYRFANISSERRKYVYDADIPHFMSLRLFRVISPQKAAPPPLAEPAPLTASTPASGVADWTNPTATPIIASGPPPAYGYGPARECGPYSAYRHLGRARAGIRAAYRKE